MIRRFARTAPLVGALVAVALAGCAEPVQTGSTGSPPAGTPSPTPSSPISAMWTPHDLTLGPDGLHPPSADDLTRLALARRMWADAGPETYTLTLRPTCFCPGGVYTVHATGDEAESSDIEKHGGGDVAYDTLPTVGGLFDLLEKAMQGSGGADAVEVTYDGTDGHPVSLSIDWDFNTIDEEAGFVVERITPGDAPPPSASPEQLIAFDEARALWKVQAPETYTMTLTRGCECMSGTWTIIGQAGDPVGGVVPRGDDIGMPTVDGLFDEIERALLGDEPAATVDVTYDPAMGYPAKLSIDWIADAIDDEIAYTVSDVQPAS